MAVQTQCHISQKEIIKNAAEILIAQPLNGKWYFSKKEIEFSTPSRSDGINYKQEQHLRNMYCSFLQQLGIELKVPQVTIATAIMFCHRFYMRQSHGLNDWQTIATVCMFLACKSEETPRLLNQLVVVAYKLIYKWDPSASRRIREIYNKQRELILIGETLLLNTVAFDMNIEHPYKSLVAAVKKLGIAHADLLKVAWNFVNDWLCTSLCLQHKPHYIAAGSLFLAAKVNQVKLSTAKGKAWWMQFDVSPKQLEDVIQEMMSLKEQSQSQSQTLASKDQNTTKSVTNKTTTYTTVEDSKTKIVSKIVVQPTKPNCAKTHEINEISRETENCQTSDTGSGASIVEDGEEPVTVKSDLSSSCKIVSVGGTAGSRQVDVNGIKEKMKKWNYVKSMKRKRVEKMDDDDDWIERELENGIVLESVNSEKQRKI